MKPDGAIVSTARDLAVFFGALIRGKLVAKPLLAKMMTIVPRSHGEGMGLYRLPSPCGRNYFGDTGGTPGYITFAAATRDGPPRRRRRDQRRRRERHRGDGAFRGRPPLPLI